MRFGQHRLGHESANTRMNVRIRSLCRNEMVWCNNGGGGGNFSKVKRLVAKWIGTWKWLFSGFLIARANFRNARTFSPRPYMNIGPCSEGLGICKHIGIRTYFSSLTPEYVGFSRHFCVLYKSAQTCHFFNCT